MLFGPAGRYGGLTTLLPVLVLASLAAWLAFLNLDFPYGIYPDERVKVAFAQGEHHSYRHPPLLIVLARLGGWLSSASTDLEVLTVGRSVSALAGVGASVVLYFVLKQFSAGLHAFLWSCVFATSPAIAVHAHFFKEDALLVFAICLGLHALMRLKLRAGAFDLVYFGLALGLAASAKYIGVINSLVLACAAVQLCNLSAKQIGGAAAIGLLTVAAVFAVSLATESEGGLQSVLSGLTHEIEHAQRGHDLVEWFWSGYGLTHFWHHLVPGLTAATVIIGLGSIAVAVFVNRDRQVMAFFCAAAAWLFLLELSPLKIVGSVRYILPVVPYFICAACIACSRSISSRSSLAAAGLGGFALLMTFHAGFSYVRHLAPENDTRQMAMAYVKAQGLANVMIDYPSAMPDEYRNVGSFDYLVSTRFQRYERGGELSQQAPIIYVMASMFDCLDGHVIAQFSKVYGDFAVVAPIVKIYDLRAGRGCLPAF